MKSWKSYLGASAALTLAIVLPACSARTGGGAGGRLALAGTNYCTPFKSATTNNSAGLAAPATSDPGAAFDDCVHRWGYTLAPARDPADLVAQASVDACGTALTALSQQTASQPAATASPQDQNQPAAGVSSAVSQQMRMAEAKALFYVIQARAAGCAPPPANSLTAPPVG